MYRMLTLAVFLALLTQSVGQFQEIDKQSSCGTEFYMPFWVKADNCSNGSCAPTQFFEESLQLLYISTNDSIEVNVTITYHITDGSWEFSLHHSVIVRPRETAVFDMLKTFAVDLEEILRTKNTSTYHYPWGIDQPVHIQAMGGGFVSIFAMSTIANTTSLFPLYPLLPSQDNQEWLVIGQDRTYNIHSSLVPAEMLVVQSLFDHTSVVIEPTVSAFLKCSLIFDYKTNCDDTISLDQQMEYYHHTTLDSAEGLAIFESSVNSPGISDKPQCMVATDQSLTGTALASDKPAAVFLGRLVTGETCEGSSAASLMTHQVIDTSFWGHTFIIVNIAATPFLSFQPYLANFEHYYEWHSLGSFKPQLPIQREYQYYVWDASLNVNKYIFDSDAGYGRATSDLENGGVEIAVMIKCSNFNASLFAGIHSTDPSHPERSTLLTVPSVQQYRNSYVIPDPRLLQLASDENYYVLTLIVPSEHFGNGSIVLDGEPIPKDMFIAFNISGVPYFYAAKVTPKYINLTHELHHTHPDGRFSVTVLGFTGYGESTRNLYSFSGGMQIQKETNSKSPIHNRRKMIIGVITGGTTLTLIVAFIAVIGCVSFYKRHRRQKHHYHRIPNVDSLLRRKEPDGANCQYDVFLSFADEDREFVEAYLYGPLEEGGFRVCWHHRDFPPGYSIIENIKNSIDHSRRVILVLSEHFYKSEYCLFELRYSCEKMLATHTQFVIPVVLQQESLPRELDHLTYWKVNPEQPDPSDIESFMRVLGSPIHADHKDAAIA